MPYCTNSDIAKEFKDITFNNTTSAVKTDQVDEFIVQADAVINSMISNRYVVPVVSGSTSLGLLKYLSIQLVAERIRFIIASKSGDEETTQDPNKKFLISPMDILKKISKGETNLPDAPVSSPNGVRSYNVDNCVKHVFKKDDDQW